MWNRVLDAPAEQGYTLAQPRTVQWSFRRPRDAAHPDLANAQLGRGDRLVWERAKRSERIDRRVWGGVQIGPDNKVADVVIASPHGALVLRVLPWTGECSTGPGKEWIERRVDGTAVKHPNQIAECDEIARHLGAYLTQAVSPGEFAVGAYVVASSPRCRPDFLTDPRLIVGPDQWTGFVSENGLRDELLRPTDANASAASLALSVGKRVVSNVLDRVRGVGGGDGNEEEEDDDDDVEDRWVRVQQALDALPQFDVLTLRNDNVLLYGRLDKFEDAPGSTGETGARSLERLCNRTVVRSVAFEHAVSGVVGAPVAFVSGLVGVAPTTRARVASLVAAASSRRGPPPLSWVDVPPTTRILFRPYGCDHVVVPEANDVARLELCKTSRSMQTPTNAFPSNHGGDMAEQIGQAVGAAIVKSVWGLVNPFPGR